MRTLHKAKIRAHAEVGQMPVLRKRSRQVRERIRARKVVIAILAEECVRGEDCVAVEYVRPAGSYVAGVDEDSLILPGSCLVELIWLLEPRTCIVQVEMKCVLCARLEIEAVKDVFAIPYIVDRNDLRRVQKPAGPEP